MALNQELLDDVIYCARYGELEELRNANPAPEYYIEKNEAGNTALHMASANNHTDVISFILELLTQYKGDQVKNFVNIQNNEGNTPLHWAALNGHLEAVELLVKSGGDCRIKNEAGHSPTYEAQQRGHEKVAEYFLQTMIEEEPDEPMGEDEQFVERGYQQQ
ncbi:hypothetical protein VTP01DRAFT_3437 [Rhizomucor pusillus]|uniref:uncharacterized protein n=1 Tax=Rhizomucor pusillus TaxID=4840 RepID=UPI003744261D